jgi:hypothetical protein
MAAATNTPSTVRLSRSNSNSNSGSAMYQSPASTVAAAAASTPSSSASSSPTTPNLNVTVILAASNGNGDDLDDMENVRNRLYQIIRQTLNLTESAEQLVGCSMDQYRNHVERQFSPGMSWLNHGAWHIDHIKPLSQFRLVDPLERARAFHYTNTRPLWAHENLSKGTSPVTNTSTNSSSSSMSTRFNVVSVNNS